MPRTSRVVQAAPGPDADEDGRRALLHQREGGLGVGRVADRDRDRHVAGELVERQRVVLGGEVAGGRHLALDEEEVGAVLGAERPEPTRRAGRRRDRRLRPRGMDLVEPAGDEVLADRLLVGLGEERREIAVGGRRDPLEDGVRIVVARLDALEVEDRQPAETRQRAGASAGRPRRPSPTRGSGSPGRCRRTPGPGRRRRARWCRCRARATRPRSRRSAGSCPPSSGRSAAARRPIGSLAEGAPVRSITGPSATSRPRRSAAHPPRGAGRRGSARTRPPDPGRTGRRGSARWRSGSPAR